MKRNIKLCILLYSLFFSISCKNLQYKFSKKDLSSEMDRLGIETALIVNSQAIDEYPIWSQNADFIVTNIEGEWHKFKLINIKLVEADWHDMKIGILNSTNADSLLSSSEQKYLKKSQFGKGEVITRNGDKIELKSKGFSTSLIVTKRNMTPHILWTSKIENCHNLVLSPNEKYVAYLCELNGLFVMRIK